MTDGSVVRPEMNGGANTQPHLLTTQQPVSHMNRVLAVGHDQPLLENNLIGFVSPDRQAGLEAKLRDRERVFSGTAGQFRRASIHGMTVGPTQPLRERIANHHAAARSRQRGNQQSVITPRDGPPDSSRRITAQPVRYEPLFVEMRVCLRVTHRVLGHDPYRFTHARHPRAPRAAAPPPRVPAGASCLRRFPDSMRRNLRSACLRSTTAPTTAYLPAARGAAPERD